MNAAARAYRGRVFRFSGTPKRVRVLPRAGTAGSAPPGRAPRPTRVRDIIRDIIDAAAVVGGSALVRWRAAARNLHCGSHVAAPSIARATSVHHRASRRRAAERSGDVGVAPRRGRARAVEPEPGRARERPVLRRHRWCVIGRGVGGAGDPERVARRAARRAARHAAPHTRRGGARRAPRAASSRRSSHVTSTVRVVGSARAAPSQTGLDDASAHIAARRRASSVVAAAVPPSQPPPPRASTALLERDRELVPLDRRRAATAATRDRRRDAAAERELAARGGGTRRGGDGVPAAAFGFGSGLFQS